MLLVQGLGTTLKDLIAGAGSIPGGIGTPKGGQAASAGGEGSVRPDGTRPEAFRPDGIPPAGDAPERGRKVADQRQGAGRADEDERRRPAGARPPADTGNGAIVDTAGAAMPASADAFRQVAYMTQQIAQEQIAREQAGRDQAGTGQDRAVADHGKGGDSGTAGLVRRIGHSVYRFVRDVISAGTAQATPGGIGTLVSDRIPIRVDFEA